MLFNNKEMFKGNKDVYFMLTQLEKAHTNKDTFSASILLTRLKNLNISFDPIGAVDSAQMAATAKAIRIALEKLI